MSMPERPEEARLTAIVSGQVQGVGFRAWVRQQAEAGGLAGSATNRPDGRVEVVAEGEAQTCRRLLEALRSPRAPGRVREVSERWQSAGGDVEGFRVG